MTQWQEKANDELVEVAYIWNKIGKELNPYLIKFIESEIIEKLIDDIEITLTTSNTLNDDDLLRGMLGLQDPRVIDLYNRDLQNRIIKLQELRNKYLTK